MIINFNNTNVSFGNLKSQKRFGEKMLKEYREIYPVHFHSDTYVSLCLNRYQKATSSKTISQELQDRINQISAKYEEEIKSVRSKYANKIYLSWNSYIETLKRIVLDENAANCGEQATLLQDIFLKNGKEAHRIGLYFYKKDSTSAEEDGVINHGFIVSGLSPSAEITDPKTWGNEAVVTDPWSNIVLGARDALDYFRKIFGIDSEQYSEEIMQHDDIDIKDYLISHSN